MNDEIIFKKHHAYLQKQKSEKRIVRLWQLLIFLCFFAIWELTSQLRWIDPLLFSSPSKIFKLFIIKLEDGSLVTHTSVTLFETIAGFILGTLFGTVIAALLWWSKRLSTILDPYFVVLNAMPKIALGPIIIVAIGPNTASIIAMGITVSVIITTLVVYSSFKEVDPNYEKVIYSFGGTKRQLFQQVILPASFPTIISALKVNVGLSWIGVIVGEFLVSKAGLGYMIIYGFQVFNFTLVLLSLLVIAVLATFMYQFVNWFETKLIKR
ncbi:ABC transporter permease [Bacillus taeanensis]|uniref:ABC transporter permease n=1 Tax=Bacillus taeanensis TaxID=273032 RepID=A0A366Y310_9BACI|nr:ABC transporter permease [Bacillus taeanensis]RBW71389.1 ABC transporter permease [Bacillus taeanensis]